MKPTWLPTMDATLKAAWDRGLSAPQIADTLGVSASAVRYRRRYLNLKQRGAIEASFRGKHKAIPSTYSPRSKPAVLKLGPQSDPKPYLERDWNECVFPVDADVDGLVVCGGPISNDARRPYCPFHLALTVRRVAHADERAA